MMNYMSKQIALYNKINCKGDVRKMRFFFDTETREIISESELLEEFLRLAEENPSEYGNITFGQYLNNCLTINNGTLEEI